MRLKKLTKFAEKIVFRDYILIALSISFLYTLSPHRYAAHYPKISGREIFDSLYPTATLKTGNLTGEFCDYRTIIETNANVRLNDLKDRLDSPTDIRVGGEFIPKTCTPIFSVAVIVPYRNRKPHLDVFQVFFHNFLRRQDIHYRIFVVEQADEKPFNRGKLFNIGSKYAVKFGFPCLILHDVDLIPMNLGNLFACTMEPRHMSSSLDSFRFNLPYTGLFGGAVAIRSQTFEDINGFSNEFSGWGGEDDDFYGRIKAKNYEICRFEPKYSRYTMLRHAKETPNTDRISKLKNGYLRYNYDGLNSLDYQEKAVELKPLYTHILVTI